MKVLVVEDEPRLRHNLVKALREEGYAVDAAEDGEEGLFKADTYDYSVIILDVMMPIMNGWEMLERLRKKKSTPVLMLTARDASSDRVKGLDGGADDYLVKPFDLPELFARVRSLIRRSGGQSQSSIQLGDVLVDTRVRQVSQAGEAVPLTAREYGIVEYLATHQGKVVSRTELSEHLFDETDDSMSNLLDVHIVNIRKKLGKAFIATRRGLGFCIES